MQNFNTKYKCKTDVASASWVSNRANLNFPARKSRSAEFVPPVTAAIILYVNKWLNLGDFLRLALILWPSFKASKEAATLEILCCWKLLCISLNLPLIFVPV
jgi:hypothetical protein